MLNSEQKTKLLDVQSILSSLFKDLGDILLVEDNRDLDDIMQRIEQMKLEINDLIDDYNIKED
tara:strand:+ start:224 stop:412 length:189 start_codon:yes stop_codon:yes gene_type:complete